jgi:hypothetical protein
LEDLESYKIFIFCEQTLKMGANGAPALVEGYNLHQKTGIKLHF